VIFRRRPRRMLCGRCVPAPSAIAAADVRPSRSTHQPKAAIVAIGVRAVAIEAAAGKEQQRRQDSRNDRRLEEFDAEVEAACGPARRRCADSIEPFLPSAMRSRDVYWSCAHALRRQDVQSTRTSIHFMYEVIAFIGDSAPGDPSSEGGSLVGAPAWEAHPCGNAMQRA
jgi:hypothetical protein